MNLIISTFLAMFVCSSVDVDRPTVLVVVGTPGTPEYGVTYQSWVGRWRETAVKAGASFVVIGEQKPPSTDKTSEPTPSDHDRLRDWLADRSKNPPTGTLWPALPQVPTP